MTQELINVETTKMRTMHSTNISSAKRELHRLIRAVQGTEKPIVLTKRGTPAAVLMSYSAYASLRESALISSDGSLMRDIRKGLGDLKAKKARKYTLDELFS
ncbi:MAG: type II toxin-antitoxin system Phd/YefM family antitoxin [Nitrospirae bacterium]|nr:type II toxin-antitoxin system Phd/YefM family antitoxin [Nitrospirota bacterium]